MTSEDVTPTRCGRLVRLVLIAYWVAMFAGTHITHVPSEVQDVPDKLLHYLGYAGLAFLVSAESYVRGILSARRYSILLAIVSIYAAADELLQIPVGRSAEFLDWMADIAGATCGFLAFALIRLAAHTSNSTPDQ